MRVLALGNRGRADPGEPRRGDCDVDAGRRLGRPASSIRGENGRAVRAELPIEPLLQRFFREAVDIGRMVLREEEVHLVAVVADDERLVARHCRRGGIEGMIGQDAAIANRAESTRGRIAADPPAPAAEHQRTRRALSESHLHVHERVGGHVQQSAPLRFLQAELLQHHPRGRDRGLHRIQANAWPAFDRRLVEVRNRRGQSVETRRSWRRRRFPRKSSRSAGSPPNRSILSGTHFRPSRISRMPWLPDVAYSSPPRSPSTGIPRVRAGGSWRRRPHQRSAPDCSHPGSRRRPNRW